MRDPQDTSTLDLLGPKPGGRKSSAQRQAEYIARMEAQGFKRRRYWIHEASRQAGQEAARMGKVNVAPWDDDTDRFSWLIGYAEAATQYK